MNDPQNMLIGTIARATGGITDDALRQIICFVRSQLTAGGGFKDRAGQPDLYYTVFGLSLMCALEMPLESAKSVQFVQAFGDGAGLPFVELVSLARCRYCLRQLAGPRVLAAADKGAEDKILQRLEAYRTANGGYSHEQPQAESGSAYAAYLASLAYADLDRPVPTPTKIYDSLPQLRCADGGYSNHPGVTCGTTTATASVLVLLATAGPPRAGSTALAPLQQWLLRQHADEGGGFRAAPGTPFPDLLSTATALFALTRSGLVSSPDWRRANRQFVTSMWLENGGFRGHALDSLADCEYTFYGLLALGALAKMGDER